jgi:hypothetical protein
VRSCGDRVETAWKFATTTLRFSGSKGHLVQVQEPIRRQTALEWDAIKIKHTHAGGAAHPGRLTATATVPRN